MAVNQETGGRDLPYILDIIQREVCAQNKTVFDGVEKIGVLHPVVVILRFPGANPGNGKSGEILAEDESVRFFVKFGVNHHNEVLVVLRLYEEEIAAQMLGILDDFVGGGNLGVLNTIPFKVQHGGTGQARSHARPIFSDVHMDGHVRVDALLEAIIEIYRFLRHKGILLIIVCHIFA